MIDIERQKYLASRNVFLLDVNSIVIDDDVEIGENTRIFPCNVITNGTKIGKNCLLMQGNFISNSTICDDSKVFCSKIEDCNILENCDISFSVLSQSEVLKDSKIGCFAHIRANTKICENSKIGSFVETKNCQIGKFSKLPHLIYCGDATVGEHCNIGCGTIFANYDGQNKHHTKIGNHTFVGCNCNLIAPICVGNNCFVAAATTVTKDIGDGQFVIGRVKEQIKPSKHN